MSHPHFVNGRISPPTGEPPGFNLAAGYLPGLSVVHKFGHNHAVTTTLAPVCSGGIWRTPQVSGATTLRIKAGGDALDTAAGSGAREITIYGLDATGVEISDTIITAGASASASTSASFLRVLRAFVTASGTYASATAASHVGPIVVEDTAGTEDWFTIPIEHVPHGQSQIGAYTVPLGKRAFISHIGVEVETNKFIDVQFLKRENILQTAAPYSAMRVIHELVGVTASVRSDFHEPFDSLPPLTDIGFMGVVASGTASASVHFGIILEDV